MKKKTIFQKVYFNTVYDDTNFNIPFYYFRSELNQ
jgi:hypothetical protein